MPRKTVPPRRKVLEMRQCAFCLRDEQNLPRLIASPTGEAFICPECVSACNEIVNDTQTLIPFRRIVKARVNAPLSPRMLYEKLDEWVVGQDTAKRILAVAVYNHFKRIQHSATANDVELEKSNILLIGPTGCGKTLLAQTLARILEVPFCIADATSLTEAGYVGEDVENILLRLLQAADYDVERAEKGIVYLDELDKTARKSGGNPSITRDVSGEGVQQALLKIIEGTVAHVPRHGGRKHPHQEFISLNTSNILFICGGTFEGLDAVIEKRLGKQRLGFAGTNKAKLPPEGSSHEKQVQIEDLVRFGMIPELIGRLPVLVSVDLLSQAALEEVLTRPRNAILRQYERLFSYDGVELQFTADAIASIARLAFQRKTGARGLRAIVESALLDVMYEIPGRSDVGKVVVDGNVILHQHKPLLIDRLGRTLHWGNPPNLAIAA
ncbi:MAG TPA: ATP-dependent Clp protease ATP-binding subunit ClpX [Anaerolineales bacterium]|nr:ATP-dependent Clp protease ATP-binding subunit ClpX [Anaerolineales bacterium]